MKHRGTEDTEIGGGPENLVESFFDRAYKTARPCSPS